MKKIKVLFAVPAAVLAATIVAEITSKEDPKTYSSIICDDVEALSSCEDQGGYKLNNCNPCKGKTCYGPGNEFKAKDCTYISVES